MTKETQTTINELKMKLKLTKLGFRLVDVGDHSTEQELLKWKISGAIVSEVGTNEQLARWTEVWNKWCSIHTMWWNIDQAGYCKGTWA